MNNTIRKAVAVGTFLSVSLIAGCGLTSQQANVVEQSVLNATQLACVLTSSLTDSALLAQVCGIDESLVPVLKQLISTRDAARRNGVSYKPPMSSDAGK